MPLKSPASERTAGTAPGDLPVHPPQPRPRGRRVLLSLVLALVVVLTTYAPGTGFTVTGK